MTLYRMHPIFHIAYEHVSMNMIALKITPMHYFMMEQQLCPKALEVQFQKLSGQNYAKVCKKIKVCLLKVK